MKLVWNTIQYGLGIVKVFLNFAKVFFVSITDYMGKNFCFSIHKNNRAKTLFCYGLFRFWEQFDYCSIKIVMEFLALNKTIEYFC